MSANSSNVAFGLLLISGGPDRIDTNGAMPELAAAIAKSEDSPCEMSASTAQILPVNGLLRLVTSSQVVPSD